MVTRTPALIPFLQPSLHDMAGGGQSLQSRVSRAALLGAGLRGVVVDAVPLSPRARAFSRGDRGKRGRGGRRAKYAWDP